MSNLLFNSWNLPESDERLELVFADRFKAYGAYQVRKVYRRACIWAMILAGMLVTGISAIPLMAGSSAVERVKPQINLHVDDVVEVINCPVVKKPEAGTEQGSPSETVQQSEQYLAPGIREAATFTLEGEPVAEIGNPGNSNDAGGGDVFDGEGIDASAGDVLLRLAHHEPLSDVVFQCVFPGGEQQFLEFFKSHFIYPENCLSIGMEGYVKLRFVVDVNGRLSRISAVEETAGCPEFTKEAIRVLQMSPVWIPAQKGGRFVPSWRELPVRITLE